MAGKTDAQRAADKIMEEAVAAQIEAYGVLDKGFTMVDYITVVEGMKYDQEEGDVDAESFGLVMRHGSARSTVAIGLLHKGLELLQFGNVVITEEEDEDVD